MTTVRRRAPTQGVTSLRHEARLAPGGEVSEWVERDLEAEPRHEAQVLALETLDHRGKGIPRRARSWDATSFCKETVERSQEDQRRVV